MLTTAGSRTQSRAARAKAASDADSERTTRQSRVAREAPRAARALGGRCARASVIWARQSEKRGSKQSDRRTSRPKRVSGLSEPY